MGKFTRSAISKLYNSWWLRGHLFVVVIIGLLSYGLLTQPVVTMALPPKQKGSIVYEQPTGTVLSTVLPGKTPTVRPTTKPTVKSVPTIIATQGGSNNAHPIPTPDNSLVGHTPACYYHVTQFYGQNGEVGTDFGCGYHTRVIALWKGIVQYEGRTCWNSTCTSTSGGVIVIRASIPGLGTESSYYLHLDEIAPGITIGTTIARGQYIGLSGGQLYGGNWPVSEWFSEGPHIEIGFDAWFLCDGVVSCSGKNVNPLPYIQEALP
jgi:hypothetical protein